MTEGERWAREALAELRASRWSARAWLRFLGDSERRASRSRTQRPALARQSRRWMAAGAAAWIVPALAGVEPFRRRLRPGLLGWGATALMLDRHLGMFESESGDPRPLGAADACTLARAWLAPLAADHPRPIVLALGLASDGVDGALARRGVPTRAGRDLEGLADAAFSAAAIRGAVSSGRLGRAAAGAEAGRLLAGTALGLTAYFGNAERPHPALARAGRPTAPLRSAGLMAGALGHRRTADVLMTSGALLGAAAAVRAQRRPAERI